METLVEGIIPVVAEKYEFNYCNRSITLNVSRTSDCRHYDGKVRNFGFSTHSFSTSVELSLGFLIEQIKFIVVEK